MGQSTDNSHDSIRVTATLLRGHEFASRHRMRGLPSLVKGAGLRILSRRGSQVQILPHAFYARPDRGTAYVQKSTFKRTRPHLGDRSGIDVDGPLCTRLLWTTRAAI